VVALWNECALDNSDFQKVLFTVQAPCHTQVQIHQSNQALTTLQKLFISDALKKIKDGKAETFEGEL